MIVGRSRELAQLHEALDMAEAGTASRLLLVGGAGIGKTALLDAAAEAAAARAFRVVRAAALQGDCSLPYALAADLVRPIRFALEGLADDDAAILKVLAAGPRASAARVGAALLQLVALVAERGPLLLTVDDVHWADPWSRRALALAAGRLSADPVAVVVATRPTSMDDADLLHWPLLDIGPLSVEDSLLLLRASLAPDVPGPVGHRLVAALGGNPLALRECARLLPQEVVTGRAPIPDPLPVGPALQGAYSRTVGQLPQRAARALLTLAVVGQGDAALLTRLLEASGLALEDLDAAVAAGLVRIDPGRGPVPVHPLARSAVYQGADPGARRALHARAAALARQLDLAPAVVTAHLVRSTAGPDEAVASALEQEAQRARAAGANGPAVMALEAAARLSPERTLRIARCVAAARVRQLETFEYVDAEPLLDLLDGAGLEAEDRLVVEWLRADYLGNTDLPASTRALLEAAERAKGLASPYAAELWWDVAETARTSGDLSTALRAAEETNRLIADCGDQVPAHLVGVGAGLLGRMVLCAGDVVRAVPLIRQAVAELSLASDEGVPVAAAWVRLALIDTLLPGGCAAWDVRRQRLEEHVARDEPGQLAFLRAASGKRAFQRGRWQAARADADEAVELGALAGDHLQVIFGLAVGVLLDALTGSDDRLAAEAARLRHECAAVGDRWDLAYADRAEGLLALARGQLGEAVERLTAVADVGFCGLGIGDTAMPAQVDLVEALVRAGDRTAAAERLVRVEAWLTPMPDPLSAALLARARALVVEDTGRADQLFRQAIAEHQAAGESFEAARTRLLFGEHLRRTRRRTAARRELLAVAAAFERLGARPWLALADGELRAAGVAARRREPAVERELTAQERRVADAVTGGRTNQEVAAALFLSPRTVEYHLGNVYRKLGVTNRTALADVLRKTAG